MAIDEQQAARYRYLIENADAFATAYKEFGKLPREMWDKAIDRAISAPTIPLANFLRVYKHLGTQESFAEQIKKAQASLPEDIPRIMAGPINERTTK